MSAKLLFVYPDNGLSYPIQLGALSAYLKRAGHETRLFAPVLSGWQVSGRVFTALRREIENFGPDFVAFCGYESALTWIKQFALHVKLYRPNIRTILGGYFPSACPEAAINLPNIDTICQGEGEKPLVEFLNEPYRIDLDGLWFKVKKEPNRQDSAFRIFQNPVASLIPDLDSLPWPDRFENHQRIIDNDSGTIKVMAGRGCYYACTYCYAKQMWAHLPDTDKHDYVRLRSPDDVINELLYLKRQYRFERVGFHDDIFWGGHMDWLRSFADLWKRHIQKPYYAAARVEMFNDEVFDLLQESGCYMLELGVESGDGQYRKKILRRNMSDEKIEFVVREAKKRGIRVWTFNMVGMLDESVVSMLATVKLNWRLKPDFAMCTKWYPLRGTTMGDEAHRRGLVDEERARRVTSYAWETVLKYPRWKRKFLTFVRWANIASACRSGLFWSLVWERIKSRLKT